MRLRLLAGALLGLPVLAASACGDTTGAEGVFGGTAAGATTGATGGGGGATTATTGATSGVTSGAGGATSATTGAGGSCEKSTYHCDADNDGHGDPAVSVEACATPDGDAACAGAYLLGSNDDCAPNDNKAYPGESLYYDVPAAGPVSTGLAFDYDCSGAEDREPAQLLHMTGELACDTLECAAFNKPEGFASDAACGQTDGYVQCNFGLNGCAPQDKQAPGPLRCR